MPGLLAASSLLEGASGLTHMVAVEEEFISFPGFMAYVGIAVLVVFGLLTAARRGITQRFFTNKLTQAFEHLYLFLEGIAVGVIGSHGRQYVPMLVVLWLMIFVSNIMSLFMPHSPTADISFNLGLAMLAIGYVQYLGVKQNGLFGHLSHFAGPKMGIALIAINVLVFCIEIISELMKNVSLTLRLTGNIHGGHTVAEVLNGLGMHLFGSPYINIPFGAFLMPIKVLTCVVQAMIFCLLLCVYISLVTHGDDHHGEGHEALAH